MNNDNKFFNIEWRTQYPSQMLKTILDCMSQIFLDPNMCGFWYICMLFWSQTLVVTWQN